MCKVSDPRPHMFKREQKINIMHEQSKLAFVNSAIWGERGAGGILERVMKF